MRAHVTIAMKVISFVMTGAISCSAFAAEEALTPLGAPMVGNADGSIPPWTGPKNYTDTQRALRYKTIVEMPRDKLDGLISPAEMQQDKPLFTITRDNLDQHKAFLTPAQQFMFQRFKDYKMPVYPSRRTAFYSDAYNEASMKNATTAKLEGTDNISGARLGIPFPFPKNGAEAIWNHKLHYRGGSLRRFQNQLLVHPDASFTVTRVQEDVLFLYANLQNPGTTDGDRPLYMYRGETLAPPRVAGQIVMAHDYATHRDAWIYSPGTMRVRRAPDAGYDQAALGTDGEQLNDQIDGFNGRLDRYDWKLLGKREVYIPYNSLTMFSKKIKYKDLVRKDGINQRYTRYEKHRVWVVDATLRKGTSHIFGRRTFYIDEDSWAIALVDCYDTHGELYKLQEAHLTSIPFFPSVVSAADLFYDFTTLRYFVTSISNEDEFANFEMQFTPEYFTPRALQASTKH